MISHAGGVVKSSPIKVTFPDPKGVESAEITPITCSLFTHLKTGKDKE